MRYYFNIKNGCAYHDAEGGDYTDMEAVKDEALKCSAEGRSFRVHMVR